MRSKGIMNLLAFAILMSLITGCGYVDVGEVGVIVNKWGSDKGIVKKEVQQGFTFLGMRKSLHKFPTFKQSYVWTRSPAEGSRNDEAIRFNTMDGLAVDMDIGITYMIQSDKADQIFAEYRMGIDEITDKYLRNMVRDEINTASSSITCEELYGAGKADFIKGVESRFMKRAKAKGFLVESLYLIGKPRLPRQVEDAISMKIQAVQRAQMRENEVAEAVAQADKDRAQAEGKADAYSSVELAKIEVMEEQARVLRENPQLIKWKMIETWDGVLPKITSGGGLVNMISADDL